MHDAFLYAVAFIIVSLFYFFAGVLFSYTFNFVAIDLLKIDTERIHWLVGMAAVLLLRSLFIPLGGNK